MRYRSPTLLACAAALAVAAPAAAQSAPRLDSTTLAAFRWRPVGPANMGGRVSDVVGIPSPSKTFYFAAAAGGIWKTTNAGTTFRPVFDNQRVISMGALAIAPSDTNQVWAGTGEQNSRNSISPGGGIYKSTDGGMTWKLMGLEQTQHIGRIVVHPSDANTVYVAALGHAWGPNRERGLYKTTDGGQTWQLVKFISDRAGFVDLVMHPADPNTLFASSYERVRGPYFLRSGGPGSALWKTTDAGKTWTEIRGGGFPETMKGRIGLAISQSNPNVIYALVEADSVRGARSGFRMPASDSAGERIAAPRQRLLNGLYRSDDGGQTWRWMNDRDVRPFYYSQVRVDPKNPDRVYWSSTPVNFSDDGGKTIRTATNGIHVDHHAMWIDPNDPEHFIVGNDGGIAITWDKGGNYDFPAIMPLGQFYEVSFDMSFPYRVCGGLQDNGSWCGPSRKRSGEITNADWFTIGGGDGFFTAQDPTDANIVYSESQGGNVGRLDLRTGERTSLVKPSWRPRYQQYEDSIIIERGDTTRPLTREQQRRVAEFRTRQRADSLELDLRFNWNTPFFLSPHSPATLYVGASRVLKSTMRGDNLYPISPDLSKKQMQKIRFSMDSTGGITLDATGAETYGTITALAESPVRPGILVAGTDDGNVWLTRNDGATWEDLTTRFPGVPVETYVVRIEPSHFDSATFYVAFDNHRRDDFRPYLYVTSDFGKSFRSIASNLPTGGPDFLHVVREDPVNRDLLFVGTDVGAYVSLDRGGSWQKFMTGLPTVPVHDLRIHPREHELIAATHGRSIWIVDIAPLQQMTATVLAASTHLFAPKTAYQYGERPGASGSPGHKVFEAQSAPFGADIAYRVASGRPRSQAQIVITDVRGDTVQRLTGSGATGLHRVTWDFRGKPPAPTPLSPAGKRDSIQNARKMVAIFDSLAQAGFAPKPVLDRIQQQVSSGGDLGAMFRRGRRGAAGATPGSFVERPGEGPPPRAAARRAAEPGVAPSERPAADTATVAGAADAPVDPELMNEVLGILRRARLVAGGFGGRTGPPMVESGDFLVTLVVGDQKHQQVLRVQRVNGAAGASIANEEEDRDL